MKPLLMYLYLLSLGHALKMISDSLVQQNLQNEKELVALQIYEIAQAGKFLKACQRAEDNGYQFPKLRGQV